MNKSNLIVLTPEFVQNNFDNLVGKEVELDILGKRMTVIIQKYDNKSGYGGSEDGSFIYKIGDEITRVELNSGDYKPGTVKINVQTLQGGRKRKRRKRKSKRKTKKRRKTRRKRKIKRKTRRKRRRTKRKR